MPNYKAVVFDMGGVVLKYKNQEVYLQAMNKVKNDEEHQKMVHSYERGHFSLTEFPAFANAIKHHFDRVGGDPEKVDLEDLMGEKDPNIGKSIEVLKKNGYKVALLTNNGFWSPKRERSLILKDVNDFDLVVESCREGHRKPDNEIYHITTKKLEMKPEECIFVDDVLENVKAAESLGWTAIHLSDNNSEPAVRQLEKLLNLQIL